MVDGTVLANFSNLIQHKTGKSLLTRQRNECSEESSRLVFYSIFFSSNPDQSNVLNHKKPCIKCDTLSADKHRVETIHVILYIRTNVCELCHISNVHAHYQYVCRVDRLMILFIIKIISQQHIRPWTRIHGLFVYGYSITFFSLFSRKLLLLVLHIFSRWNQFLWLLINLNVEFK